MLIEDVAIRKIFDSRGSPTVEVEVYTMNGLGIASAPSGASTGKYEVVAFPKGGVDEAIERFDRDVAPKLLGEVSTLQAEMDELLHEIDGTDDFSEIGGNVAVATSLAIAKAGADSLSLPLYFYLGGALATSLPHPLGNVIGGGRHAVGGTDIQEFLSIALGPSAKDSVAANALVHRRAKELLMKKIPGGTLGKGDEGAWVVALGNKDALRLLSQACEEVSDEVGFPCRPSLDIAASELYKNGKYHYKEGALTPEQQMEFVADLVDEFRLYSVEDPLDEDDFEGYAQLTEMLGSKCLIVGDDIFVTNYERLKKGIDLHAANSVLIKPNQIGTLTDTCKTVKLAHEKGYKTMISHRSGETNDDSIVHLGVAFGCHAIKTGIVGGERVAKLNELIRIEEELK